MPHVTSKKKKKKTQDTLEGGKRGGKRTSLGDFSLFVHERGEWLNNPETSNIQGKGSSDHCRKSDLR